jgi:glyoxylase-like metal-dependent hydrolase (beta-lactamase superfamily II)
MRQLSSVALLVFCATTASAQIGVFDPVAYAPYERLGVDLRTAIRDWFGIHAQGSDYATRKIIADVLDFGLTPALDSAGGVLHHPFLYPESSCFVRAFYLESLNEIVTQMDVDAAAPAPGVRVFYGGGSGIFVQTFVPSGPGGALAPYRVAVDFSDNTFGISVWIAPGCIQHPLYGQVLDAFAARLDACFVTHEHLDHASANLIVKLHQLGKPTYVTQSTADVAPFFGFPPQFLTVIPPGQYALNAWVSVDVYLGAQGPTPNNVYFLDFAPAISVGGVTVCHFGDNGDLAGLEAHVQSLAASGFIQPTVFTTNCNTLTPTLLSLLGADVRVHSPVYEFGHLASGSFIVMALPSNPVPPSQKLALFYGESAHWPSDFPL